MPASMSDSPASAAAAVASASTAASAAASPPSSDMDAAASAGAAAKGPAPYLAAPYLAARPTAAQDNPPRTTPRPWRRASAATTIPQTDAAAAAASKGHGAAYLASRGTSRKRGLTIGPVAGARTSPAAAQTSGQHSGPPVTASLDAPTASPY